MKKLQVVKEYGSKFLSRTKELALVGGTLIMSNPVFAAINTTASESKFTDGETAAQLIGGLGLALVIGIVIYKYIRRAA